MNTFSRNISNFAFASLVWATSAAMADTFTATDTLTSGNEIDDPPIPGLARTLTVSTAVTSITDISITLDISSATGEDAWNGDLYAQLTSPLGTLSVLLNRSGYATTGDAGYGDKGYNITLNDGSANPEIHLYQSLSYTLNGSGQLTGTWKSDGASSPGGATQDKPLSQFLGENPNGIWTLFVSDQAGGNRAKLNSWSIDGIGAVPEPEWTAAAVAGASLVVGVLLRRRKA
jgi:subtilisin-like proprotein convertase family protein